MEKVETGRWVDQFCKMVAKVCLECVVYPIEWRRQIYIIYSREVCLMEFYYYNLLLQHIWYIINVPNICTL